MAAVCADGDQFEVDEKGLLTLKRGTTGLRQMKAYRASDSPAQFRKADYPWLKKVFVRVQGAGGGSAGADTGSDKDHRIYRSGGAAGAYGEALIDVAQLGDNETIVVGKGGAGGRGNADGAAGGSSSFGGIVTEPGGAGSPASMDSGTDTRFHSGTPGAAAGSSTGWSTGGGSGDGCFRVQTVNKEGEANDKATGQSGAGGDSMMGFGGAARSVNGSSAGQGFGSGAGGAAHGGEGSSNGAAGRDGIVVVYLYA